MVLPFVLDHYIKDELAHAEAAPAEAPQPLGGPVTDSYVELAKAAGLASHYEDYDAAAKAAIATGFVAAVREMNKEMRIPSHVPEMTAEDVPVVAARALGEAHGANLLELGYPVPTYMSEEECNEMVARFLPPKEKERYEELRRRRTGAMPRARL